MENNKIETFFSNYILGLTIYKVYFQNNFFCKKLEKMLKPVNKQLEFVKDDEKPFCHFKPC